ncbi:MAG: ABC transporter ATP-binding protein [Deltaproteobacteria bacterium]|nr:ABC transporter ATP-binding protein [Deltaproteobacteria bacterium]
MIRLSQVSKSYRDGAQERAVLDAVDLEVGSGDYLAILGRSGSGKSTLLNLIGALDSDFQGSASVAGSDLKALDDDGRSRLRAGEIGFVFQSFNLVPAMTALQNVVLGLWFARPDDPDAALRERAREMLAAVGLEAFADRRPDALSGGERQRVAIARALAARPRILLCDEPTGNLDEATGQKILDLFGELHAKGMTLVVATHEARVSERASRVLRLVEGRLEPAEVGEGAR